MKTIATIFSGGGGVEVGACRAGIEPIWGIEHDPEIAEVYRANVGHVFCEDARHVNISHLSRPDILHASPPCQAHSLAFKLKGKSAPKRTDAEIALCLIPYLQQLRPDIFILENVSLFRYSQSFSHILTTLWTENYWVWKGILNAADFGVPSTRRRLFLIAVRGRLVSLPLKLDRWVGWSDVIKDLIPTLPFSSIARWQMPAFQRAKEANRGDFIIDGKSLTAPHTDGYRLPTVRFINQPCWTLTATLSKQVIRLVTQNEIYKLTPRALARITTFPDSYQLPDSLPLALKIIGNAVPPLLMQKILEAL